MKIRSTFLTMLFSILLLTACKYDFILPEEEIDPNTPISFSAQVSPIFSTNDKCTSCHNPGDTSPDLTSANAYNEIVPDYIFTATPESSLIYSIPAPSTATHTWKKYTAGEAAIVLEWIKQGAKNN